MACSIELVTAPFELYWAPTGTAFPDVDAAPTAPWSLIGTGGSLRYSEDGVTVAWEVETEDVNVLGDIDPVCINITGRDMRVRVRMLDHSLEQLRIAFNLNPVVVDPGPPETSTLSLDTGSELTSMALLVRGEGKSPELLGANVQWEFDPVIEVASKELTYVKGQPAGVDLEFRVLAGHRQLVAESNTAT